MIRYKKNIFNTLLIHFNKGSNKKSSVDMRKFKLLVPFSKFLLRVY